MIHSFIIKANIDFLNILYVLYMFNFVRYFLKQLELLKLYLKSLEFKVFFV